ncbi:hypothetical protein PMAYCL1PPCAC_21460, partial [Pristionchus mayeri]
VDANGSCYNYPKFAPTVACTYPGWCLEIMSALLRSGNIPHEFIVDRNLTWIDWGRLEDDGKFSGILGRIVSGEVDTACLFYQKSVLRLAHFDFTAAVSEIQPTFIIRELPVTLWTMILNFARPYDTNVWICMLAAVFAQVFGVWSSKGIKIVTIAPKYFPTHISLFAWDVFDDLFNGVDHAFHSVSGKLARVVMLVFQKGLLLGMYSALLLTALLTPADSQTDIVRLIESGKYKLISDKSKWFAQEIQLSSEQLYADLRVATNHNPIIDVISDQHALDLVSSGGYIYQSQNDGTAMVEVEGKCYTFIYSEGKLTRVVMLVFQKGLVSRRFSHSGIIMNFQAFQIRKPEQPKCPVSMFAAPGATDPLNFWSVWGIFLLGSCGLAISVLALGVETI